MQCLALLALLFSLAHGWWLIPDEVCYKDYGIGCFNKEEPFTNSLIYLPEDPQYLGVDFLLFTRENPDQPQTLLYRDQASIKASNLKASRPTKVITHGYTASAHSDWMLKLRDEILKKMDANVILVDWAEGADSYVYRQSVANTRAVGAMIGEQIKAIMAAESTAAAQFHLMGHSLGAHTCGYAGDWVPGIGRITGLDPAGPAFAGYDIAVRLDPSDATYVDVIHTDMDYLGSNDVMGHADFYPNGGEDQPGCLFRRRGEIGSWVSCSHSRAPLLLISSLGACTFKAYPCSSYEDFQAGKCSACGAGGCPVMGWGADQTPKAQGALYLKTTDTEPFC